MIKTVFVILSYFSLGNLKKFVFLDCPSCVRILFQNSVLACMFAVKRIDISLTFDVHF